MTPTTTQGGEMSLSQTLNAWYIYLYHLKSRWWFPPPSSVAISFRGYDKPRHFMGVASLPSILSWWYASKTLGFPPSGIHEGLGWDFPYSFFVVPYNPGGLVSQHPRYTVRPHWVDLGYGICQIGTDNLASPWGYFPDHVSYETHEIYQKLDVHQSSYYLDVLWFVENT